MCFYKFIQFVETPIANNVISFIYGGKHHLGDRFNVRKDNDFLFVVCSGCLWPIPIQYHSW